MTEVRFLLLLFTLTLLGVNADRDCSSETIKPTDSQPQIPVYKVEKPSEDLRQKVTLVGLFPIHNADCKTLSKIKNYRGFQRMEAMLWALEQINRDRDMVNKVFIEALIYDTCSDPVQAIKAVNHAKKIVEKEKEKNIIIGVVGAAYSSVTIPLAMTTASMEIPLVSYASTNKQLSKQDMFARTVWSDDYTATAVGDLVKHFSLTSLKIIGTEGDTLGNMLDKASKKYLANQEDIKLCDLIKFPNAELNWKNSCEEDGNDTRWKGFHDKADQILKSKVDAFVIHIKDSTKMQFFKSLQCKMRENDYDRKHPLQLIATGTMGITDEKDLSKIFLNNDIKVELTVIAKRFERETVKIMNERLQNITKQIREDTQNPWIKKIWSEISNCTTIEKCEYFSLLIGKNNKENLYIQNPITKVSETFQLDTKLENVIDAIALFGKALINYFNKKYVHSQSPKQNTDSFFTKFDGREFFNDLMKTSTNGLTRPTSIVKLDGNGDKTPKYDIYQFRKKKFFKVGNMSWDTNKHVCKIINHGNLILDKNFTKIRPYRRKDKKLGTECQPKCNQNERKIISAQTSEDCCHICYALESNEIYHDKKILECKPGKWPKPDRSSCSTVLIVDSHDSSTASGALSITIGVIFLLIVGAYMVLLFLNRDHPVVRKSGTYFMAIVFTGALFCLIFSIFIFAINFSVFSCLITKILSSLGLTFMLSAILIKTRKIYNIFILTFKDDNFTSSDDYTICPTTINDWINDKMDPKTQEIAKVMGLISIQIFVIFLWILYPTMAGTTEIKIIYPANRALNFCNVSTTQLYVVQMYNMFLLIICTGYAYLARNVPSEYNESRFIGHCMFAVSLISLSFIILNESVVKHGIDRESHPYDPEYMWALYSISLSFTAVAVIGIMYTNKVVIILRGETE